MKVALISFYCLDSTMPLAKNLSLKGIDVDLFCILNQWNQNAFLFEFTNNLQPNGFIDKQIANSAVG